MEIAHLWSTLKAHARFQNNPLASQECSISIAYLENCKESKNILQEFWLEKKKKNKHKEEEEQ